MEEDREREELRLMSSHHRSHVRVEDWVPWPYTHNKVELNNFDNSGCAEKKLFWMSCCFELYTDFSLAWRLVTW